MAKQVTGPQRLAKSVKDIQAAALLSTATEQVDRIKRTLAKLGAAHEEAAITQRLIEEGKSGQEKIIQNIQEDLDQLRQSLFMLSRASSQAGFVAERVGEIEEEFSDVLNAEIDQVIRLADNDLSDQTEDRLRNALEGAMQQTMARVLAGLTKHRRKMFLELIIDTMMHEAIDDESEPADAERGG
jgi:hypothetical protein